MQLEELQKSHEVNAEFCVPYILKPEINIPAREYCCSMFSEAVMKGRVMKRWPYKCADCIYTFYEANSHLLCECSYSIRQFDEEAAVQNKI